MMKYLILLLLNIINIESNAQKFLQLEQKNSTQTIKWGVGDEVEFQMDGEKNNWHKTTILEINYEQNIIMLETGPVNINKITKIRFKRNWSQYIGLSMMTFGVSSAVFDGISILVGRGGGYFIKAGPVFFVTGLLIKTIFKYKVYHFDTKYRLRLLDLTLVPFKDKA